MSSKTPNEAPCRMTRRQMLTSTAAASLGIAAAPHLAHAGRRPAQDPIRVGLIGCGGRGTGAAINCYESSQGVRIAALGDLFGDRLGACRARLLDKIRGGCDFSEETSFAGFDAFQRVLDTDIDMVILATPPGFRPQHLAASIDAGKHVFMEKPVAVDPPGVRSVMASADRAAERGRAIVAGTQRRHQLGYLEAMERIHDGAIGELVSLQVYWNQGGLWDAERKPRYTDMEWQIRNWLYFTWLSGDHIVEQHIHNLDVANWALDAHPVTAVGMGGRQVRTDARYGHIFDHFAIEYEYPSGAKLQSYCRQIDGTATRVGEHLIGTAGTSDGHSWIRGPETWRLDAEEPNPYVQEHTDLIASIRTSQPLNEGRRVAETTLTAIMGREAAYTGKEIIWDELLAGDLDLSPPEHAFGPLPTPSVAVPGVTRLDRDGWA